MTLSPAEENVHGGRQQLNKFSRNNQLARCGSPHLRSQSRENPSQPITVPAKKKRMPSQSQLAPDEVHEANYAALGLDWHRERAEDAHSLVSLPLVSV
ncbi:hypothetical protein LMH87_011207 [Akanthomyces muscarius]|uniref:Uncharacterized protein n=1 Tax=Akanthomyces muscarius TaxID=2231603 RepID=A0A9W8UJR0_AKAMU|nr:hypothetical protein LMH87_011207 [Akanthomyces muscarius]KAJ4150457.1 hypothetical protein LMH87_011207 [Akanthomyces muscarius]